MASEKILKFVEDIKELTVLELNELVKAIEEEFGVSAAAPVVVAGGAAAGAAASAPGPGPCPRSCSGAAPAFSTAC